MFDISEFIIAVYLCVDHHLESLLALYPPRTRGFAPRLSDSEVLTREIVGEYLGRHSDTDIWKYLNISVVIGGVGFPVSGIAALLSI